MGTYTTNYNLFMPTVGEQGWGTLVNTNFSTIDTTMAGLNTRLTAVENEVNGNLSCTSVTTSGTITSTGKIAANGGIGTTSLTTSSTITSTGLITANGGIKGGAISGTTGTFSGEIKASIFTQTETRVITVTPSSSYTSNTNNTLCTMYNNMSSTPASTYYVCILPKLIKTVYTGSVKIHGDGGSTTTVYYATDFDNSYKSVTINANATGTISFAKVPCLYITCKGSCGTLHNFTLS